MKNTPLNSGSFSSARRISKLACLFTIVLASGWQIIWPTVTTLSSAMKSALKASAPAPAIPVPSQTNTFYLHGTGPADNPPTLLLNLTAPTATTEKFKDSASINRNGGNPWKEVGTWPAAPALITGSLTSLSDLHVWLGLKNSDDQGTYFDLRVEAYKNSTLVASGQSLCIIGVTRNPSSAKEVTLGFDPFSVVSFNGTSDVLKLKVLTRVGSNAAGGSCGGHNNAVGLRLYFDAVARASRFSGTIGSSSDTTAPVLTVAQPAENSITAATQISVSGTFSDQSPTIITVNGITATLQGNNFTANVPLTEGQNALLIAATDSAGNGSQGTRHVVRDTTAPVLTIQQPSEAAFTNAATTVVSGTFNDATTTTVTVNNVVATQVAGTFSATIPLVEGENALNVVAVDAAGNQGTSSSSITRDSVAPVITQAEPPEGQISNSVDVGCLVEDASPVSVTANGTTLEEDAIAGSFMGSLDLSEGPQQVHIVATDAAGNQSVLTRNVTIDKTAPLISEVDPAVGAAIDSPVTVHGRVTDATAVNVTVNGVSTSVGADGLFTVASVPVVEGDGELEITATDAAGNVGALTVSVNVNDRTPPSAPSVFPTISPTRLDFQTIEGRAEPGAHVNITGGTEPVTATAAFETGLFAANLRLAAGPNSFSITATDAAGNVSTAVQVSITSDSNLPLPPAGQPSQINIATGNAQKGLVGSELPRPLIAIVTDRLGEPVADAVVTFTVQQGSGEFVSGGSSTVIHTDALGHASVRYVSGLAGIQQIRTDFVGNAMTPLVFLAEALEASASGETSVSGIVLDQNLRALPNALVRIGGQQTRTGTDGRFTISNAASGPHQLLEIIGRDQIPFPGRWPNITFDMDVLAGVNNSLGRPLFLPRVNDGIALPLDANNIVTRDTVYELPVIAGEPSIKVTARAGTHVTFPPDVTDKRLSVTRIATNRVPMVLEEGRATNLYISVQPSGAIFEQPLEISFPNLDRLAANSEVLLMSFDHDAGRYVQFGTGHVSADGRTASSDPGSGIRVGAWHGLPPDPPTPQVTVLSHIQVDGNPVFEGKRILSAEAWVEGTRSILIDGVDAIDEAPVLNYRATFSVPPNSTAFVSRAESKVQTTTQVQVKFKTDNDKDLPTPYRIGITYKSHNRTKKLKAIVNPKSEVSKVTLTADAKLTLSDISVKDNTIKFSLVGVTQSVTKGDAKITATYTDSSLPQPQTFDQTVSVVVPAQIATPHDTNGRGGLIVENAALNTNTTPRLSFVPANRYLLGTLYVRRLTIVVWDQFKELVGKDPISGSLYDGADITESLTNRPNTPINQKLNDKSEYTDPAAIFSAGPPGAQPIVVASTDQQSIDNWRVATQHFVIDTSKPQPAAANVGVEVDLFVLNPAIVNRQKNVTSATSFSITWP